MKVAVIGPVCKDTIVVNGSRYKQPGGVTYYAGNALASLGIETKVIGSCREDMSKHFSCEFIHIKRDDTLQFFNHYKGGKRYQKALGSQSISYRDVQEHVKEMDYIILGPLLHDNLQNGLIERLAEESKIMLVGQGMIRHVMDGRVYWKNAHNILNSLGSVDYLLLNEEEHDFVSSRGDASKVRENGVLAVTQAASGAQLFSRGERYNIPAYVPAKLVDPTGAGDSFCAGLIAAKPIYPSISNQGCFAAMVAAMSTEQRGPFKGDAQDVIKRLVDEML